MTPVVSRIPPKCTAIALKIKDGFLSASVTCGRQNNGYPKMSMHPSPESVNPRTREKLKNKKIIKIVN